MKTLRFSTLLFAALSMGLSFAHLLELPPRVFHFDARLWIATTTGGLYALFGTVGAGIEVAAVLLSGWHAFRMRHHASSRRPALAAAICFAVALALWFIFVAPANAQLATWTVSSYPADWTRWRNQWEFTHALDAVIKIAGFGLLLLAVLSDVHHDSRSSGDRTIAR